ncbi:MAG: hypothetical protein ABSA05_03065 [Opitutaceae bacterium]|jgi:hypothetical protein
MTKTSTAQSLAAGSISQETDYLIRQMEALRRERLATKQEVSELIAPLWKALDLLAAQNQALLAENARLGQELNSVVLLLQQQLETWERLLKQQETFGRTQERQLAEVSALLRRLGLNSSRSSGLI